MAACSECGGRVGAKEGMQHMRCAEKARKRREIQENPKHRPTAEPSMKDMKQARREAVKKRGGGLFA